MVEVFKKKIDKICSSMTNVFKITDDMLNADFKEQCKDHDETLDKVLRRHRQANLKLKKR